MMLKRKAYRISEDTMTVNCPRCGRVSYAYDPEVTTAYCCKFFFFDIVEVVDVRDHEATVYNLDDYRNG